MLGGIDGGCGCGVVLGRGGAEEGMRELVVVVRAQLLLEADAVSLATAAPPAAHAVSEAAAAVAAAA